MTSISLRINGACARAKVTGTLTSGMVGIPLTLEYDEAWDGLTKNLVCQCRELGSDAGECRTILDVGETAVVAHEVMKAGTHLYLGVEGFSSDGELVIPTTWALCGVIEKGANTAEDLSTDPTLPVWEQLQTQIGQLREDAVTREQMTGVLEVVQSAAQAAAISAGRAEAAAKRAEEAYGTGSQTPAQGLSQAQIDALNGMFKVCLYNDSKDVDGAIAAFEAAFGITGGESPDEPEEPGVVTYAVEYELVNVSSNNSAAAVAEGASYSAVLTAADGYTMDGAAVSVTMGGVDVTADVYANGVISIPAVTGNVEITASAVYVEEESEPELNTDGLLGFFDFRNRAKSSGDGSSGYYEAATAGDGRLYAWAQAGAGNECGKGVASMQFCAGAGYTVHDFGHEFTWILKAYCDGGCTLTGASAYITPSNQGALLAPKYNTSAGTGNVASTTVGKDWSRAYHTVAIRASGSKLHIFKNAEQIAEYDGADIDGFVSWYGKCTVNNMWANEYTILVNTAMVFYDRALTDVEIVEMDEYLKTLEVSE